MSQRRGHGGHHGHGGRSQSHSHGSNRQGGGGGGGGGGNYNQSFNAGGGNQQGGGGFNQGGNFANFSNSNQGNQNQNQGQGQQRQGGGGGSGFFHSRRNQMTQTTLRISGYPANWNFHAFRSFIQQNSGNRRVLFISNTFREGQVDQNGVTSATINVAPSDVRAILGINGMTTQEGNQVSVTLVQSEDMTADTSTDALPNSNSTSTGTGGGGRGGGLANLVFQTISSKYDPSTKLLNLSRLVIGTRQVSFNDRNVIDMVWTTVGRVCPEVTAIDLSHNDLEHLSHCKRMVHSAPNVENLSLDNTSLRELSQLDALRGYRDTMKHLIITNTPLIALTHARILAHGISIRFPSLQHLNNRPFAPVIQFPLPPALTAPVVLPPVLGNGIELDIQPLITKIVPAMLQLFDTDRTALLTHLYTDESTFSISLPSDAHPNDVANYSHLARTLVSSGGDTPSGARIVTERVNLLAAMQSMPITQHDIEGLMIDALIVPTSSRRSLIHVSISGDFFEVNNNVIRSFHRVITLTPAQNDAGCTVVTDHIFIVGRPKRLDTANTQQQQQQQQQQQPRGGGGGGGGAPAGGSSGMMINGVALSVSDAALVQQVMTSTGVNADIAFQALQVAQGNVNNAILLIQQKAQQAQQRK